MTTQYSKITPTDYNSARLLVVSRLGTSTTGTTNAYFGYGQSVVSSPVNQYDKVTEGHLDLLRQDITKAYTHQNGAAPTITDVAAGDKLLASLFTQYGTLATGILQNESRTLSAPFIYTTTVAANQLATVTYTPQTETYAPYTGTAGSGAGWKNYAYYESTVTFATADDARYFFNAGSTYNFTASHSGGTQSPDLGKSQNKSWDDLLTAVTADAPSFGKTYFYRLTNAYNTNDPVYIRHSADTTYSANYYRITAKSNVADNSLGGATTITFKIEFVDAFNDGNATNYDGVDGTFTSTISRKMPKGPLAGGAVYVAVPTDPVSTPSNGFTENGTPIYITAAYSIAVRSPSTITENNVTAYFDFTATNYYTGNTITWTITATTTTGLSDFIETGWTASTNSNGYKVLTSTSSNSGSYANSTSSISIVTNPDRTTEGTETFTISAVGSSDGSGGGMKVTTPTPLTVTDSSKTDTPGITVANTAGTVVGPSTELSCIAGNGNGPSGTWRVTSAALTGGVDLIIYGFYIDVSSSDQSFDTWTITTPSGFPDRTITQSSGNYTLPASRTITNGNSFDLGISVGSSYGSYPRSSTVVLKVVSNAGTVDGSGAATGPTYRITSTTITVQINAPTVTLGFSASPASVSFSFIGGSGVSGSASTTLTLTNSGNSPATLSNFFAGYAGSIQSSAGSLTGTISAGGTKTVDVTYSYYGSATTSGSSSISITGTHPRLGSVSSSPFSVAVTATKAVPNISASATSASIYSAEVTKSVTDGIVILIANNGGAPLTISAVSVTGPNMTIGLRTGSTSQTIQANSSASLYYNWTRSRIGSSTVAVSITSDTGGNAGTNTSFNISTSFQAIALTPTFKLLNNGAVTGTGWTDASNIFSIVDTSRGTLKKNSRVRTEFGNMEPNATGGLWLFWTDNQSDIGLGGTGKWSDPSGLTDPKLCPVSSFVANSDGFAAPWPGTGPNAGDGYGAYETKYWRAGRNRFYAQIPVGKKDDGTQVWYTNSTSGTTAAGSGRWASNTTAPESACGTNQVWVGFTVVPDITATWSDLAPIQGATITVTVTGAPSNMNSATGFTRLTTDGGSATNDGTNGPYTSIVGQTYTTNAQGELTTQVLVNGQIATYTNVYVVFPSAGDGFLYGVGSNFVTFDIQSPVLNVVGDATFPPEYAIGSPVSPYASAAATPAGTFKIYRRYPYTNGGPYYFKVFCSADNSVSVYCQGNFIVSAPDWYNSYSADAFITVSDGYTHWRFDFTNSGSTGPGNPGYFAAAAYYAARDLYFATSNNGLAASKW